MAELLSIERLALTDEESYRFRHHGDYYYDGMINDEAEFVKAQIAKVLWVLKAEHAKFCPNIPPCCFVYDEAELEAAGFVHRDQGNAAC